MTEWLGRNDGPRGALSPVVLAHEVPFRLAALMVEPALRRVSDDDGRDEILQPRTMQVLVCFATAEGAIITRDELTTSCWSGVAVGDDSINRVIAQLRRLSEGLGRNSFVIETITKVGYRLLVQSPPDTGSRAAMQLTGPTASVATAPASTKALLPATSRTRRWMISGVSVVALLVASAMWLSRPSAPAATPSLAVDAFTSSSALAGSAVTLRSAVVSAIAPGRFDVVTSGRTGAEYRLNGRLISSPVGMTLFTQLQPPGSATPIWSGQKQFATNVSLLGIGAEVANTVRCIIEGAEEPPLPRPSAALAGWASYCENNVRSDWDEDLLIEALRVTTRADPHFVSGQVTLASTLGYHIMHQGGRDPESMRPEALAALTVAERLDPQNSAIYLTRAVLTPLEDFLSRGVLVARALQVRQLGWGEEANAEGYFLESVGRLRGSIDAYKRSLTIAPGNPTSSMAQAEVLSMAGRYRVAQPIFEAGAVTEPDRTRVDRIWLTATITGQDWATARRLIPTIPDDQVRVAMAPLLSALEAGDRGAAYAAGAAFERIARDTASLSALTVTALAWSGRDAAAIDAAERRFRTVGYNNSLGTLYSPAFARARQRPEFETMVRRVGLFDYWRTSGTHPDFCGGANAPAFCARLL